MSNTRRAKPAKARTTGRPSPSQAHGVTHEPDVPINWPDGHVSVELTADDEDECIAVTIHGVTHYLHTTTAIELRRMLTEQIDAYDARAEAVLGGTGALAALKYLFAE